MSNKKAKKGFTAAQKEILYGFSQKIGKKRNCSGMYVRCIINGTRNTNTALAQNIVNDLNDLLALLQPET